MFGLSVQELVIVGVVAVLLFGKNLPDVAKKFGGMYRDFVTAAICAARCLAEAYVSRLNGATPPG